MKKIIILMLIMVCVWGLAACTAQTAETASDTTAQVPNPVVEMASLEDVVSALGGGIVIALPEGATNMTYSVIGDEVGQVGFTWEGDDYVLRVKKSDALEDISGMYIDFEETEQMTMGDYPYEIRYTEGQQGVSQWYDELTGTTYSVSMDTGASAQKLEAVSVALIPAD